jgi:single-strand DNA-binding protein
MLSGFIAGNLGKDAELRTTQSGAVCSFSVAVEQRLKGEKKTVWIRCSMWGKRGETLVQYLRKGTRVAVTGELSLHEYEGKTSLECRVSELTLLGGGKQDGEPKPATRPASSGGGFPDADYGNKPIDDDQIPFCLNVTTQPAELWWNF